MSSDIGGTRPGKYESPCLRQAVPPAPEGSSITVLLSVPLLKRTYSPFHIHCAWVFLCVCVGICSHSLEARGTLPPNTEGWEENSRIYGYPISNGLKGLTEQLKPFSS